MMTSASFSLRIAPAIAVLLVCGDSLHADILSLDAFKNISYEQTGNGNTLTLNGTFYSADLNTSISNSYTSVSMTYPGPGSPLAIPQISPTDYRYQTSLFATQGAMDAAFPFGLYSLSGTGGTPATASYSYTSDDYAHSNPYLTGTDYSSLQGMNPLLAFTLHLSPFTTGGAASSSFIFVTIYDQTLGAYVFNDGFLAPTTTTVVIPAGTLVPGDQFTYEVDFSNRDLVASPGATNPAIVAFDVRADGNFSSAAVPEPSALLLTGLGLLAAALQRKLR